MATGPDPIHLNQYGTSRDSVDYSKAAIDFIAERSILLPLIMRGPDSTGHQCEWYDDKLTPLSITLNDSGGISNSDSTATFVSTAGITVGTFLRASGSGETIRVTAVNANGTDLTLSRNASGTGAEAVADGVAFEVIGKPSAQGAVGEAQSAESGTQRISQFMLESKEYSISRSRGVTTLNDAMQILDRERKAAMWRIALHMEKTAMYGSNTAGSSTVGGSYMGILPRTYTSRNASRVALNAVCDEDALNASVLRILDLGGVPDTIIINGNAQQPLYDSILSRVTLVPSGNVFTGGQQIETFKSMHGPTLKIVVTPKIDPTHVWVGDMSQISFRPKAGAWWLETTFGTDRDTLNNVAHRMLVETALEHRNAGETSEWLTGVVG